MAGTAVGEAWNTVLISKRQGRGSFRPGPEPLPPLSKPKLSEIVQAVLVATRLFPKLLTPTHSLPGPSRD